MGSRRKPDERDTKIGRALAGMRERAGKSQQDVATFLGVSYQQVGKYERGEDGISAARLQEIVEYLNGSTAGGGFGEAEAVFQVQRFEQMQHKAEVLACLARLRKDFDLLCALLGAPKE